MKVKKSIQENCRDEILQLHAFFQGWLSGRLANTDEVFDRCRQVFVSEFQMVSAAGTHFETRDELLTAIRSFHGRWENFVIKVEDISVRQLRDTLCMVTYTEWQEAEGEASRRKTSALMDEDADAPNGVVWLHVHETWLPGGQPSESADNPIEKETNNEWRPGYSNKAPKDQMLIRFEAGDIKLSELPHAVHVEVAWRYAREYTVAVALERFSSTLRHFAGINGKAGLYHETITWTYMLLIHERVVRADNAQTWEQFVAANQDIMQRGKQVLNSYYSSNLLWSDIARTHFILPDRVFSGSTECT